MSDSTSPLPVVVRDRLDAVRKLCRRHQVNRLSLFGSAVDGRFDPAASDLDFAIEFEPDAARKGFDDPYFRLKADLERLFARPVDLIEFAAIENRIFRQQLEETRIDVYPT